MCLIIGVVVGFGLAAGLMLLNWWLEQNKK